MLQLSLYDEQRGSHLNLPQLWEWLNPHKYSPHTRTHMHTHTAMNVVLMIQNFLLCVIIYYSIKLLHKLDCVDHISASIPTLLQLTPVVGQVITAALFLLDFNAHNLWLSIDVKISFLCNRQIWVPCIKVWQILHIKTLSYLCSNTIPWSLSYCGKVLLKSPVTQTHWTAWYQCKAIPLSEHWPFYQSENFNYFFLTEVLYYPYSF